MTAQPAGCENLDDSLLCVSTGQLCVGKLAIHAQLAEDIASYFAATAGTEMALDDSDDNWNGEEMYPRPQAVHEAGPVELSVIAGLKKKEYDAFAGRKGCSGVIAPGTEQADCPTRISLAESPSRARVLKIVRMITKRV